MIDQREIMASELWRELRVIQRTARLSDADFNYLLVFLAGCIGIVTTRSKTVRGFFPQPLTGEIHDLCGGRVDDTDAKTINRWRDVERRLQEVVGLENTTALAVFNPEMNGMLAALRDRLARGMDGLYLFEVAFRRYIGDRNPLDREIQINVAELASHLVPESGSVWDYFIESGDFAVLARKHRSNIREINAQSLPNDQFPVRLRLALHGIRLTENPDPIPPHRDRVLLINHPTQAATPRWTLDGESRAGDDSALAALERLLGPKVEFDFTMVVVPTRDRSARGIPASMRHDIVQNYLLAVVDVPYTRSSLLKKSVSVWLLAKNADRTRKVLFVDATKPLKMSGPSRAPEAMLFIASVVRLWLSERMDLPVEKMEPNAEAFMGLFLHEFRHGFKDVPGLCRVVRRKDIAGETLSAAAYLKEATERPLPLSTLDSHPVLDLLTEGGMGSKCIYVIGNNGEGKSLLLAELVDHLSRSQIPTVGISFGLTDRFHFAAVSKSDEPLFTYLGARTSEKTIQIRLTNRAMVHHIKKVQIDQKRLKIFQGITDLLGFSHSLFLIPNDYNLQTEALEPEVKNRAIQLTNSAAKNKSILAKASDTLYTLGLMRKNSKNDITLFHELSSGEQQLLTLAIKLVANGNAKSVMLIDEPEISLHVSWQKALPAMFEMISTQIGCAIVVATHSPVIIASALHDGDHCFTAQQRTLTPIPRKKRQSVETALFDSFNTYTHHTRRVHERCAATVSETIRRINSEGADTAVVDVADLLAELDSIAAIVETALPDLDDENLARDRNLIGKTRAAIVELVGQPLTIAEEE